MIFYTPGQCETYTQGQFEAFEILTRAGVISQDTQPDKIARATEIILMLADRIKNERNVLMSSSIKG
jgi:hypothetical protein